VFILETTKLRDQEINPDWERRYFDNLERRIEEVKSEFTRMEDNITKITTQNMANIQHLDKLRHEHLLTLGEKMDRTVEYMNRELAGVDKEIRSAVKSLESKMDSMNRWLIGIMITVIFGVMGFVVKLFTNI